MLPPCASWEDVDKPQPDPPSLAALFPTDGGARVRRRRVRPHGLAEPLLQPRTITVRGPISQVARIGWVTRTALGYINKVMRRCSPPSRRISRVLGDRRHPARRS